MDAIINGFSTFFELIGHSFDTMVYFFGHIPTWVTEISATFQLAPSFLLQFLVICLNLTILVGILKWLPF